MAFVVLQCALYKLGAAVIKTQRNMHKYFCHQTPSKQTIFFGGPHLNKLQKKLMGQTLVANYQAESKVWV